MAGHEHAGATRVIVNVQPMLSLITGPIIHRIVLVMLVIVVMITVVIMIMAVMKVMVTMMNVVVVAISVGVNEKTRKRAGWHCKGDADHGCQGEH